MKIISFSDLHLEITKDIQPPDKSDADLMILSGDIINMHKPEPLARFLRGWKKPVLFVPGNHEYYTERPMNLENRLFKEWLHSHYPKVQLLLDEATTIEGINFFGGTMWTDFAGGEETAMTEAQLCMPDYMLIRTEQDKPLVATDTIAMHQIFKEKLLTWFDSGIEGPRIVITHHAPVLNPKSVHVGSVLIPAFNSLDMTEVIKKYQPEFWFYGHTHECDNQVLGKTRIISNQLGYQGGYGYYECNGVFDEAEAPVIVNSPVSQARRKLV